MRGVQSREIEEFRLRYRADASRHIAPYTCVGIARALATSLSETLVTLVGGVSAADFNVAHEVSVHRNGRPSAMIVCQFHHVKNYYLNYLN